MTIAVLGMIVINPQINQRTISRELNIYQKSVQRILEANHFHAYHIQRHQALTENQENALNFVIGFKKITGRSDFL